MRGFGQIDLPNKGGGFAGIFGFKAIFFSR